MKRFVESMRDHARDKRDNGIDSPTRSSAVALASGALEELKAYNARRDNRLIGAGTQQVSAE